MIDSILNSVKKNLNIDPTYTAFDDQILLFINGVFSTLNQLGIGPEEGFAVEDDTATWDAFLGSDLRYNSVKTYVYLCVRLLFDPPQASFHVEALKVQKEEYEVRLSIKREGDTWVPPVTTPPWAEC